ncbi:MAG: laccase domain-containing protein [Solirubrobacterales bacterium]|nr:laccase domain-containing protein [Solirubrobacterales bacterium]
MNVPGPFEVVGEHLEIELIGARVLFTTRRGGLSSGPYASLNLGRLTGDDEEAVERNRELVEQRVGARLLYGRQVHGDHVALADSPTDRRSPLLEADGHATERAGVAPMVLTADCLPVALGGEGAVAMVHAGWRGLAAGVIEEGVRALRQLGKNGGIEAAIGPGAGPCCYQVGEEVHGAFASYGSVARRGENLDMKAIATLALERAGVEHVHDVGLCTICSDPGLFYSHRRDRGVTGRQAGIAWLN